MKYPLYLVVMALLFTGCKKELSLELQEPPVQPKFQLRAFYSDIPIDFDESDEEVKLETDLWAYVYDYIKDDINVFHADSTVEVHQHEKKMPGLEDAILYKKYAFGEDDGGAFMIYLDPFYRPLTYRLYEKTEDYFVIGLKWRDGAHLFSRFERIP